MGVPREAPPAKLIAGIMHRPGFESGPLLARLSDLFGAPDHHCAPFPFDHSEYYRAEMGSGLLKFLVSFGPLIPQDRLAEVKLWTNSLERDGIAEGGRVYNIDPGILTLASVILATTKGHAHRIYMGEGIYEEITLLFHQGAYKPLPWTYPDYRTPRVLDFLNEVRETCHRQMAALENGRAC